jgi:hypothetical protein
MFATLFVAPIRAAARPKKVLAPVGHQRGIVCSIQCCGSVATAAVSVVLPGLVLLVATC